MRKTWTDAQANVSWDDATLARLRFVRWLVKQHHHALEDNPAPTDVPAFLDVWEARAYVRLADGSMRTVCDLILVTNTLARRAMMATTIAEYRARGVTIRDHRSHRGDA